MNIDVTVSPSMGTAGAILLVPAPSALELGKMFPTDANGTAPQIRISEGPQARAIASDESEVVRISPRAYLKSMWTLITCCFTDPFSTTVIDVTTGERVQEGQ